MLSHSSSIEASVAPPPAATADDEGTAGAFGSGAGAAPMRRGEYTHSYNRSSALPLARYSFAHVYVYSVLPCTVCVHSSSTVYSHFVPCRTVLLTCSYLFCAALWRA